MSALARVLDQGSYILGREVKEFEARFAAWIGKKGEGTRDLTGVGVASGTDAIEIALRACGIGEGDLVFTVSHTAVGGVVGIERSGARHAFVDIDSRTYTMDPASLDEAAVKAHQQGLNPRAVVITHLYGHPANMIEISDVASRHGLLIIEDCAQAHGAMMGNHAIGSLGDAAAFSFYPTKNLGALGDGGLVLARDPAVAVRARELREYGWRKRYVSETPGVNSRLDEIQAAVLNVRLRTLDEENKERRALASRYDAALDEVPKVQRPVEAENATHVYHQYVIRVGDRDVLREHLQANGIGTIVHYPVAVHQQPAYRKGYPKLVSLERTEAAAREVLSLPMYPGLAEDQVIQVTAQIGRWYSKRK